MKIWEYEKQYDLVVDGKTVCAIVPDFTVILPDGRVEVHEIKSPATKTDVWRIKSKLFGILYPHIRYRLFESGFERKPSVIQWD